ncbi:AarF/ABC1/UbiB kinase family protein [Myxococcus stipitatus]|uniref:ABC1 kinase family protein n=1 Tax=Myxococcus stipitatus TaxID=83455 RepID=UPI0031456842
MRVSRLKLLDPDLVPTPLRERLPHSVEIAELTLNPERRRRVVLKSLMSMWGKLSNPVLTSPAERGAIVRNTLDALGGVFIKLGQLLALRNDLFPTEFCLALSDLHDRATAFPPGVARRYLEEAFGRPLESVFSEFSPVPVAAASIGQCHIARLRQGGHWVAVKLQRPDAPSMFWRDLDLFQSLLGPLSLLPSSELFNWEDALWELQDIVKEELDYRYEAAALATFRKKLRKHQNIYVPQVFTEWCRPNVIVLEYIPGVFMSELLHVKETDPEKVLRWQRDNNVDLEEVGRTLLQSLYRQMFEEHLFHGDLHPGNIVLLKDSQVCLIDFGSVGRLDIDFLDSFHGYMKALAERDFETAILNMLSTSANLPNVGIDSLQAELLNAFRTWHRKTLVPDLPHHEKSVQALGDYMQPVLQRYRMSMNWSFLRMNRAFGTLDIAIQKLLPTLDHPSEMKRYQKGARKRARKKAWNVRPSVLAMLHSGAILRHNEEASLALTHASNLRRVEQLGRLRFKSSLTKGEFLILSTMRVVQVSAVALGLGLLAFWLAWQGPLPLDLFAGASESPAGSQWGLPRFAWWEGLLLLALCGKAFLSANRVVTRLHETVT